MATKAPEAFTKVASRTASVLLPRFQKVLSQWEVDTERQSTAPGSPDVGVYLRQYVEKSVLTDRVTYEAAKAELEAAERLVSPDFFKRYPNVREIGITNRSYDEMRAVNMNPDSSEARRVLWRMALSDSLKERKELMRNGVYLLLGLFVLLSFASLSNAVIRRKTLDS